MGGAQKVLRTNLGEHPAVRAWSELSPARVLPDHVVVLKKKAKGAVYRLAGVGPAGGAVIAKRCSREKAAIERAVYEQVLPRLPVATLEYHGCVAEADGHFGWLFLEDVGGECYAPNDPEHRRLAARWLALLHTSADGAEVKAAFAERGAAHHRRYLDAIGATLPRVRALPALPAAGIDVLERIAGLCERVESSWHAVEALCEAAPATLVHADCLAKNVHVRATAAGRSVAPFDWGGAGWGVAATDLGQLALPRRGPPDDAPDYAAYLDVARRRWEDLDLETVRRLADLGQLFWALKVISRGLPEFDCGWARPEDVARNLAIYAAALERSLGALRSGAQSSAIGEDGLLRAGLSAWRSLAAGGREPQGVDVLKRDGQGTTVYRLRLDAATSVIAKRSPRASAAVERTIHEAILPQIPVPVPRYHGAVDEAGGGFSWLFVEDAGGREYRPQREAHRAAAARWLATLHRSTPCIERVPLLPARGPDHYRTLLRSGCDALRRRFDATSPIAGARAVLGEVLGHLEGLATRWGELERACEGVPDTLVHGDFVEHNVHVRDEPSGLVFLPFDWEKAGWGVPAEDLASVDPEAYAAAVCDGRPGVDRAALRRLASAGRIFRCLVFLDWATSGRGVDRAGGELEQIERCGSWLGPLLRRGAWRD